MFRDTRDRIEVRFTLIDTRDKGWLFQIFILIKVTRCLWVSVSLSVCQCIIIIIRLVSLFDNMVQRIRPPCSSMKSCPWLVLHLLPISILAKLGIFQCYASVYVCQWGSILSNSLEFSFVNSEHMSYPPFFCFSLLIQYYCTYSMPTVHSLIFCLAKIFCKFF